MRSIRFETSGTADGGSPAPRGTSGRWVHFPGIERRFSLPVQGVPSFGAGAAARTGAVRSPSASTANRVMARHATRGPLRRKNLSPGGTICAPRPVVLHAAPMPSPAPDRPLDLLGLPLDRLTKFLVEELGERPFHARQLYRWIHQRGVVDFEQMTDLSKSLRAKLQERCALEPLSKD